MSGIPDGLAMLICLALAAMATWLLFVYRVIP